MDFKSFSYMLEYVKSNYPMYYKYLEKSLLRSVALKSIYKNYGMVAICQGRADEALDELVNDYMKKNFPEVWELYTNMNVYVSQKVLEIETILSPFKQYKVLQMIVNEICIKLVGDKEIADVDYMNDSYNDKIKQLFKMYVDTIKSSLLVCIDQVLNKVEFGHEYSDRTHLYIKNLLIKQIVNDESIEEILDNKCDRLIVRMYVLCLMEAKNNIDMYIKNLINNMDFPFGIPLDKIIEYYVDQVFNVGEIDIENILNGEYDDKIIFYGNSLRDDKERLLAQQHIDELVFKNVFDNGMIEKDLFVISGQIYDILINSYGKSNASICRGECDSLILTLFNRAIIREGSVSSHSKPVEIKHETEKKNSNLLHLGLLILAIFTSLSLSLGKLVGLDLSSNKEKSAHTRLIDYRNSEEISVNSRNSSRRNI